MAIKTRKRRVYRKPKDSNSKLIRELWSIVRDKIKKRDGYFLDDGLFATCIVCDQECTGKRLHAGHYYPSKAAKLLTRYHPDNIHAQCQKCNVPMGRSQTENIKCNYAIKIHDKIGNTKYRKLNELSKIDLRPTPEIYKELIKQYSKEDWQKSVTKYLNSLCKTNK